ncbi:phospho-N-acetylmuramoyl-pentapeptide-transferase [Flavobacteriaceae bacterium UJ101]|nr:phospho-N-acetylmuramoyl-pentapeptide-transferase [Flavobacteriaceae bacterium UJ101]
MLYHLFEYLEQEFQMPGAGLFQFITFRAAMAFMLSLFIGLIFGKKIINFLRQKQMGELVRDLGLDGQKEKEGTPTMGGVIIILATLIPVFLFARLTNVYTVLLIVSTLWMGGIGFLDDYIKVFKKDKEGLAGKFKVLGQIGLGIIVGTTLYFNQNVIVKENLPFEQRKIEITKDGQIDRHYFTEEVKSTKTNMPFLKNNEFDYADFLTWIDEDLKDYAWLIFIPVVIFIITAVSNGANLTDGIDGLAAGSSSIIVATLALFAWLSSNVIFADYLNIMYIPNLGELTIFCAALLGGLIGFLWYNTFPAQVFMGDTGSLTIGGIIAVLAIAERKELLIPILCGIFFIETLSVMMQVSYFKYTKKKYGEGRRIFKMSPIHHHFQKEGYHESKIVTRFLIIGIILASVTIITLKLR